MKAKLISTEGTYLEAILEINGLQYCVMDEITSNAETMPRIGEVFEFEFSNVINEEESWDSIFRSNPEKKKCIEKIKGWEYRALGEIISINPVKVDCGLLIEENVIYTKDPKVIGEFIGFTINTLSGYPI